VPPGPLLHAFSDGTRLSAMPRYLTPEWVESFDTALGALDLSDAVAAAGAGSLAAADGTFSVVQVVTGVPEDVQPEGGAVHLVLTVTDGRARLGLDPTRAVGGTATIVLGYTEALAMARGELDPADALAAGRVRVRGDLAALVAGQDVLAEAAARLGAELEELTEPSTPAP
jgi:SCP-2 sterol transfer family